MLATSTSNAAGRAVFIALAEKWRSLADRAAKQTLVEPGPEAPSLPLPRKA
jgi:hypothetical protein